MGKIERNAELVKNALKAYDDHAEAKKNGDQDGMDAANSLASVVVWGAKQEQQLPND